MLYEGRWREAPATVIVTFSQAATLLPSGGPQSGEAVLRSVLASCAIGGCSLTSDDPAARLQDA